VPRRVLVRNASLVDHSIALGASLCILLLIARYTNRLAVTWYESLRPYWLATNLAAKALLVILLAFEVILLHSSPEDALTGVTAQSEVLVMTVRAERSLVLAGERSVHQGLTAVSAVEARLVPVLVLVRQVLEISSYGLTTGVAAISKESLITLNAERLVLTQDVAPPCQSVGAVETVQTLPFQHKVLHLETEVEGSIHTMTSPLLRVKK